MGKETHLLNCIWMGYASSRGPVFILSLQQAVGANQLVDHQTQLMDSHLGNRKSPPNSLFFVSFLYEKHVILLRTLMVFMVLQFLFCSLKNERKQWFHSPCLLVGTHLCKRSIFSGQLPSNLGVEVLFLKL